jgi:carbon starvation protein CstA
MAAPRPSERTRTSPYGAPVDQQTRTLLFNVVFFATLASLSSAARAAQATDWWHRYGQVPLMLAGVVLLWIAWWHADNGRDRQALTAAGPAVVILSAWLTSVHGAAF